ncbi:Galactose mutarotase [Parasphingorhabdus marina DSM 22363]|uniref:Galactose mutarotase n=1 Tax=Parasphingorhabdus marina DSM 22363 TaxID=1123272 RepID=A0A1N6CQ50_9SPHN|nr:aldose 1-epimerase family protein [Parasphingorhabdus marina]SIN60589.1 Galactose mutarotase [Parasphingorhabdus marina DSM 22363]
MGDGPVPPDLVSIASDGLRAAIHPLGAELWSLRDMQDRELMTDADPAYWTGRAPLLFPIVGRLRHDRYRLEGREYAMEKHGFARRQQFELTQSADGRATFSLCANATTRAQYPFEFRLDMAFELKGAELRKTATVANQDDRDMPFSFGFHPAFAWPLPFGGAAGEHEIHFEKAEPAPIRRIGVEPGLIAPAPRPSPVRGRTLRPEYALFEEDAIIWDDLASRQLTWGVPGQTRLDIAFPDTPWLGIWQIPGARYLCIEPWAGMADPAGYDGDFTDKPGMMTLAPGESRSFHMYVGLRENGKPG